MQMRKLKFCKRHRQPARSRGSKSGVWPQNLNYFCSPDCTAKQILCVCVCVCVCVFWGRSKKAEGQPEENDDISSPECLAESFSVDLTVKKIHCNSLNQGRDHKSGVWGCLILQGELKDKSFGSRELSLQESELFSFPSLATESSIPTSFFVNFPFSLVSYF